MRLDVRGDEELRRDDDRVLRSRPRLDRRPLR
jgi:hypothetical protein